jgi:hypothetical protein
MEAFSPDQEDDERIKAKDKDNCQRGLDNPAETEENLQT